MSRAEDFAPIQPVLAAFRRGTRRSSLRLLVVVCPRGHTLFEVFPTVEGPVALWASRERFATTGPEGAIVVLPTPAITWHAQFVAWPGEQAHGMTCRCTEDCQIEFDWVAAQIASGARRVVAP